MWAMYLLALHPEWQARLRGEVRGACGNDSTSPPTLEQLGNAPLLACVTNETLRLYPAVPHFDRYATADVDLKPVPQGTCRFEDEMFAGRTLSVPAGCVMTFSIGEIHRDPRYW